MILYPLVKESLSGLRLWHSTNMPGGLEVIIPYPVTQILYPVCLHRGEKLALKRMCVNNEKDLSVCRREINIVVSYSF